MGFQATLSFVKGKGQVKHNNRDYETPNVDKSRMENNIYYKQENLEEAYQKCFGRAIEEYNQKQVRNDRKKSVNGYMDEIRKNSSNRNGEKLFYESVVMIGDMRSTGYASEPERAKQCEKLLDDYMKDFQRRNPNLYVFNAVLHTDEATPHLHIDYIPVAKDYKQGLESRNSLSKALGQQMHDIKPSTQKDNTTMRWQAQERGILTNMCKDREIEVVKGVEHEDMTISQYRSMKEYETKEIERITKEIPKNIDTKPMMFNKKLVKVDKKELEELQKKSVLKKNYTHEIKELRVQAQNVLDNSKVVYNFTVTEAQKQADKIIQEAELKRDEMLRSAKEHETAAITQHKEAAKELSEAKEYREYNIAIVENSEKINKRYRESQDKVLSLENQVRGFEYEKELIRESVKQEVTADMQELIDGERQMKNFAIEDRDKLRLEVNSLKEDISSLKDRLVGMCQNFTNTIKAFNMLRYDKQDGYKISLNDKQLRLFDAIDNYAKKWLSKENQHEMVEDVQKHIGLSNGIEKEVKALEPKKNRIVEHER